MAWFTRRSRGRQPYRAVTDEERVSRYVYLLNTLPESVIEKAHTSAFKELPLDQRRQMFDELRPFMSEAEQKKAPQPALLAQVLGRATAERRAGASVVVDRDRRRDESDAATAADPMVFVNSRLATSVAIYFLASHAVSSYFTVGAGSLAISSEPGWVGELGGVDVGGAEGGYGGGHGGGFDGGGFGDFGGGGDFGGF